MNITHADMPKTFYDYVKMRDLLVTWPITKYVYDMRKRTPEEEIEAQKQLKEMFEQQGLPSDHFKNLERKIIDATKR